MASGLECAPCEDVERDLDDPSPTSTRAYCIFIFYFFDRLDSFHPFHFSSALIGAPSPPQLAQTPRPSSESDKDARGVKKKI